MSGAARRGFTLVETVVSLAILSLVMSALAASAVFLSRALPGDGGPALRGVQLSRLMDLFGEDVALAVGVRVVSDTEVVLTVPDRDGDGAEDEIGYVWDSVAGTLSRTRGGDETDVMGGVTGLAFGVGLTGLSEDALGDAAASELALYGEDVKSLTGRELDAERVVQPVEPVLGGSVTAWSVDSVRFLASHVSGGKGSSFEVAVYEIDGGTGEPRGSALASEVVTSEGLSSGSYATRTVSFGPAAVVSAGTEVGLVFRALSGEFGLARGIDADGEPEYFHDTTGSGSFVESVYVLTVQVVGRTTEAEVPASSLSSLTVEFDCEGVGRVVVGARALSAAALE